MSHHYHHIQIGYLTILALAIILVFSLLLMAVAGFNWIGFAVLVFIAICLILFATLTVEINDDLLEIRFGTGIIRKKFALTEIESRQVVKNPWYYGWGVRLTPHGWLYNVSGLHAVEMKLKNGKRYRIGTDVPHELERAIRQILR